MAEVFPYEIVLEPYSDTKTWKQSVYGENLIINQLILGSKAYGVNEVLIETFTIRNVTLRCRLRQESIPVLYSDLTFYGKYVTFTLAKGDGPVYISGNAVKILGVWNSPLRHPDIQ